ncbi:MAG: hypothetical protein AB3N28_16985 [Kordiimonas sp.]
MKKAIKIYTRDFGISMVLYVAAVFGINMVPGIEEMPMWQAVLIALIPILPILLSIRAVLTFHRSMDELHKQIVMEAVIIAFFLVGLGSFSYGFLEGVGFPRLDVIWIFPALIMTQGAAQFVVRRKYL